MENEYIEKDQLADKAKEEQKKQRAPKVKKPKGKQSLIVQILNGEILTKDVVLNNLGYIFFCIFLLMLIVAKGYLGKQLTKDIDQSLRDLDATKAEYVEAKAKLEDRTKRYELVKKLEPRGVKETTRPAKVIRIKKENEKE